jgi:aspartate kinase
VQKYGGTSVATPERLQAVAERIAATRRDGHALVVVVSAMGTTTDDLLALARRLHPAPPPRELDMLLTAGERIAMALLSIALHARNVAAVSFTGSQSGILTDDRHSDAKILAVKGDRIRAGLDAGRVVIVAGFQGVSAGREITTLGRGGSDTTAVALAAALEAEVCEIYTDVDGVYSADPNAVATAIKIEHLDYDEMLELAARGARVLHPRSVEVARRFAVPVHVRSSFKSDAGTVVSNMERIESESVRGVAADTEVTTLVATHLPAPADDTRALLGALGGAGIRTVLVLRAGAGAHLCVVVPNDDRDVALAAWQRTAVAQGVEWREERDVALVSAVGHAVHSHPGTVARVLDALAEAGITVRAVASSALSVTCVIERDQARAALVALHARLGLEDAKAAETR